MIIKIKDNYLIIILLCITLLFSYKAQNENIARNEWSKPYDYVFEMSEKLGNRVSVDLKLNESKDISDSRFYELSKISTNKYGICLLGVDCQEDYIITNRSETLEKNAIPLIGEYGYICSVDKESVNNQDQKCQDLVKGKFSKINVISGMNEFSVKNNGSEVANVYIAADENINNRSIVWGISTINSECNPVVYSFEYENDFSQGARNKISQSTSLVFSKKLGIYVEGLTAKCELKINIDKKIIKTLDVYDIGYTDLILIKNINKIKK
jgi:hypothetical protein